MNGICKPFGRAEGKPSSGTGLLLSAGQVPSRLKARKKPNLRLSGEKTLLDLRRVPRKEGDFHLGRGLRRASGESKGP